jgi:hypothetical protein
MLSANDQTALRDMASRFARARLAPDSQKPEATGRFVIAIDEALRGAVVGERHAAFKARRPAPFQAWHA